MCKRLDESTKKESKKGGHFHSFFKPFYFFTSTDTFSIVNILYNKGYFIVISFPLCGPNYSRLRGLPGQAGIPACGVPPLRRLCAPPSSPQEAVCHWEPLELVQA